MAKQPYIDAIKSYLGEGFITYPINVISGVEANGLTTTELQQWTDIARTTLQALSDTGRLMLVPEGTLSTIQTYIENIRNNTSTMTPDNTNLQNMVENCFSWLEQIIALTAPYRNLADNTNYEHLTDQVTKLFTSAEKQIEAYKKKTDAQQRTIAIMEQKASNVLRKASSGVLSNNFGELSNSWWNWALLSIAAGITITAAIFWLATSHSVAKYLTDSIQADNLDYRVFFAKWSATLPYLVISSVGALELRSRIRYRDTYLYRQSVAGSLDGYTESLLNKVEDIQDKTEKSEARKVVIQFMIDAMLELTKNPSVGSEKSSVGIKVRDIAEAKFNTQG